MSFFEDCGAHVGSPCWWSRLDESGPSVTTAGRFFFVGEFHVVLKHDDARVPTYLYYPYSTARRPVSEQQSQRVMHVEIRLG